MPSSPCLSPPISPRTSPPTTTACGHQLSRKHSRQECLAPLPCLNRVHSTPSSYRPKAWRARASRACRSVRDAHRHSEASSQSLYHRPAPAAQTAVRHTGSPLRSAAPLRDETHCAVPPPQSGRLRLAISDASLALFLPHPRETLQYSGSFRRPRVLLPKCLSPTRGRWSPPSMNATPVPHP